MPLSISPDTGSTIQITAGVDDDDAGIRLRVDGDDFDRIALTPDGQIQTGDGTAAPSAGPGDILQWEKNTVQTISGYARDPISAWVTENEDGGASFSFNDTTGIVTSLIDQRIIVEVYAAVEAFTTASGGFGLQIVSGAGSKDYVPFTIVSKGDTEIALYAPAYVSAGATIKFWLEAPDEVDISYIYFTLRNGG